MEGRRPGVLGLCGIFSERRSPVADRDISRAKRGFLTMGEQSSPLPCLLIFQNDLGFLKTYQ